MRAPSPDAPGLLIRLEEKLGLLDDLQLVGYAGHGSETTLYVEGRLIEKRAEAGGPGEKGVLHNIKNTIKRFESREIPGARIRARFRGGAWDTWTDNEGFFKIDLPLREPLEPGWHEVQLEVVRTIRKGVHPTSTARMLVPPADAEFGIISDLDDTVIKSSAGNKLRQLQLLFGNDVRSRAAFAGVEQLYHGLVGGPSGTNSNPIFYISRSGWNIYDVFQEFLEDKNIPPGPLFLQDLAFKEDKSSALGHESHKRDRIRSLLDVYPRLQFVLIGDSGQDDPETYRRIVHQKPDRVKAIYLRDVSPDERDSEVRRIAAEMNARGVPTALVANTLEAGEHAAAHGLITRDALEAIRQAASDAPASETEV
jgi:phosphatidate phosphatase APP1